MSLAIASTAILTAPLTAITATPLDLQAIYLDAAGEVGVPAPTLIAALALTAVGRFQGSQASVQISEYSEPGYFEPGAPP